MSAGNATGPLPPCGGELERGYGADRMKRALSLSRRRRPPPLGDIAPFAGRNGSRRREPSLRSAPCLSSASSPPRSSPLFSPARRRRRAVRRSRRSSGSGSPRRSGRTRRGRAYRGKPSSGRSPRSPSTGRCRNCSPQGRRRPPSSGRRSSRVPDAISSKASSPRFPGPAPNLRGSTSRPSTRSSAASACRARSWSRSGDANRISAASPPRGPRCGCSRRRPSWAAGAPSTIPSSSPRSSSSKRIISPARRCSRPGRAPWASRSSCPRSSCATRSTATATAAATSGTRRRTASPRSPTI